MLNCKQISRFQDKLMSKVVTAIFDGEVLRPDQPLDLASNQRYLITIETETTNSKIVDGWDVIEALAGTVDAPTDWAIEHDHYLYGTPKRNSQTWVGNAHRFKQLRIDAF
jgi:predicted DNA-binding antitoxin AbrB/MazE fold protein